MSLFQHFPSLLRSPRPVSVPSSFSTKDQNSLQGQPQWQGALTSFTMNGSQNSMFKWSQEVAHTFSQWFSQGTIANHTVEALSCLFSLLWHLWGFDVYRSVDLVDRSEYPTLVMIYGSVKQCEWAGWVPFIASNHPYSLCHVCLFCALADGPRLEPGQVCDPLNDRFWHLNGYAWHTNG
jgi:hypothetical protein